MPASELIVERVSYSSLRLEEDDGTQARGGYDYSSYHWGSDGKCMPLGRSRSEQGSWLMVGLKWFLPGFINGSCIFISMWLLHIATYRYVHRMIDMENELTETGDRHPKQLIQDFGGLKDPGADLFRHEALPLTAIDLVAAVFPATFMFGVFWFDDLRLYTKIMLCNAMLALLKGSVDSLTILPDSGGWKNCKARLTPAGVNFMKGDHSFFELFTKEALGVHGKHLRWCSDMMISGHTYFTAIFALGAYELVRRATRKMDEKDHKAEHWRTKWLRRFAISAIVIGGIGEQSMEIYFVMKDRFHYSVDLYIALVLTLTLYTNALPVVIAKWWWLTGSAEATRTKDMIEVLGSQADILIPVCCVPFCCAAGRLHTYDDHHMEEIFERVVPKEDLERAKSVLHNQMSMGEGFGFSVLQSVDD